jgi:hypothetical protein
VIVSNSAYSSIKLVRQTTMTASNHHRADHKFTNDTELAGHGSIDTGMSQTQADIATRKFMLTGGGKGRSGNATY